MSSPPLKVWTRGLAFLVLPAVCCSLSGCGGNARGTVAGRVTLDGGSLPTKVIVHFVPSDGVAVIASVEEDGSYSLPAPVPVPTGEAKVEAAAPVRLARVVGHRDGGRLEIPDPTHAVPGQLRPGPPVQSSLRRDECRPGRWQRPGPDGQHQRHDLVGGRHPPRPERPSPTTGNGARRL
jgi:hypothetical protein